MGDDNDSDTETRSPPADPEEDWSSREAWESLPCDPDLGRSLGYELVDWDVITSPDHSDNLILLPEEQEALAEDAFIIAEEDAVCDLRERL
jgi:hypothetical protein